MSTIFSKIISGEIPAFKVAENDEFIAFLDLQPLTEGHTLIVPKIEIDYIFDIEDDLLGRMMIFSKQVAKTLKQAIPCKRIGVAVIGLEVPHAHIHLVPMNQMKDINFMDKPQPPTKEALAQTLKKILDK
jgi:histidine triad (HIT) family protein